MKVAAAAILSKDGDFVGNIPRIEELLIRAKYQKASYLFLGESILNGFDGLKWEYAEDISRNTVELAGEIIGKIKSLCLTHEIGLGFGCYERKNGFIGSSYLIVDDKGKLENRYVRISDGWKLKNTDSRYKNGNSFETLKVGKSICLVAVCGDLWTPHFLKDIEKLKFDTILWPLYIDYSKNEWDSIGRSEYCEQIKKIGKRTILINSISELENGANGGVLEISSTGNVIQEIEMNLAKLMIFDI